MSDDTEKIVQLLTEIRDSQREAFAIRKKLVPMMLVVLTIAAISLILFSAAIVVAMLSAPHPHP